MLIKTKTWYANKAAPITTPMISKFKSLALSIGGFAGDGTSGRSLERYFILISSLSNVTEDTKVPTSWGKGARGGVLQTFEMSEGGYSS